MIKKFFKWIRSLFKRKHIKESLQNISVSKDKPKQSKINESKTAPNSIITARPDGWSYEKYKKRLAEQNKRIKNYLRGRLIYKSSELITDSVYNKKTKQYFTKTVKRTWPPLVRNITPKYN